jgi:hypothetical protein
MQWRESQAGADCNRTCAQHASWPAELRKPVGGGPLAQFMCASRGIYGACAAWRCAQRRAVLCCTCARACNEAHHSLSRSLALRSRMPLPLAASRCTLRAYARVPDALGGCAHRRDCIAGPGRRTVRAVRRNRPGCWRIHVRLRELPTRHRLRAARLELRLRRRCAVPRRRGGEQRAGRHSRGRHVRQPPGLRRGVPAAVHAGRRRATMMRRFAMRSCDALKKTATKTTRPLCLG